MEKDSQVTYKLSIPYNLDDNILVNRYDKVVPKMENFEAEIKEKSRIPLKIENCAPPSAKNFTRSTIRK